MQVTLIQKSTYHDTQTSGVYRWKSHIVDEDGYPLCGIHLDPLWWDQTIEYPLEFFHGCKNCKRIALSALTKRPLFT
jgi:hypothetical protein